jgi:predicted patatin/cPLA2 family phospholipase|tara:strand:- start:349 stop:639 length:291 start_codon:yes stop_codon:yes gene_type:complete
MIQLTEQEKELFREGKLDIENIEEHRKLFPVRSIDLNEVDKVKEELKQVNELYKESILKNKELYQELVENRKRKEGYRNEIAELRIKKKKLLGLVE